jgi:predicted ATPase/DNA-binding winged helix-turn-helix (wHTH) protein
MANLQFGDIEILPEQRQALVHGKAVALGSRAFDLLLLLVEHRDRVVTKDEIFSKVWPGLVIEENNLSVQIHALRRALGADAVATITGRGYRFTAAPAKQPASPGDTRSGNLPVRQAELFGRESELAEVLKACASPTCFTLCGLAGVGKTALATVAAQHLAIGHRYAQGAWRVELTDVRDPSLVARAVCDTVGLELEANDDPLRACLAHLRHQEVLLLLDNCEHVIDATASLVEALMATSAKVSLLATSQEPLRVPGERVLRLNPLAVPQTDQIEAALDFGAVRMLLARVQTAMGGRFDPSPQEMKDLVAVCAQLDGIPLALEFAASRVPLLGVAGVRSRLHDRLRLLSGGSRSAPLRHRSLQAALEWSHHLLSPRTQGVLHRLSVFPSGFSLEGARTLLEAASDTELIEQLDVLVERSLVSAIPGARPRYRMLETTRSFALDCLAAGAGQTDWHLRHARVMADLCMEAARQRDTAWMWQEMPNARAALAWALAAPAAGHIAVTIATHTSVVLAAGGAIGEALDNLLKVQSRLDDSCPAPLVARYWHWLGRLGVEGRLPSSMCVQALARAEGMFAEQGETRHRHACMRHLAEAELRSGRLDAAEKHLEASRQLESAQTTAADRMRRLRVEVLLADALADHAQALRHAHAALELAEAKGVERYRLLLMADIGWTHLQMGQAVAAVSSFKALLQSLDLSIRQGLARARALSGLTAALVAADRIDEAMASAAHSVPALQQANLLRSRCEVFAWVLAAAGQARAAAQLIGAGEAFSQGSETQRDPISQLAGHRAEELIRGVLPADDLTYWRAQGASAQEEQVLRLLEQSFAIAAPPEEKSP